jgi:hypothetical protein
MKDIVTWRYEMFLRVREYGAARLTEFPVTTLAGELFADLNQLITAIEAATAKQASERSAALESSDSKSAARDELRRDLEAISRTARALALSRPGLEDKFRAPRSIGDQALLTLARAFAADALPLKDDFIRRGLPEDFLEDLASDIEAFEQAINRKIQTQEAQVAATATIDPLIERGINIVRELDAIMRNKYANDAGALAAWLSASHTQRPARRQSTASPTNTPSMPAP